MKLFSLLIFLALTAQARSSFFNDFILKEKQNQKVKETHLASEIESAVAILNQGQQIGQRTDKEARPTQSDTNNAESAFRKLQHRVEFQNESFTLKGKESTGKNDQGISSTRDSKELDAKAETSSKESSLDLAAQEKGSAENTPNASSDCKDHSYNENLNSYDTPYGVEVKMQGGILLQENLLEVPDNEVDNDEKSGAPLSETSGDKLKKGKSSSIATITLLVVLAHWLFWL